MSAKSCSQCGQSFGCGIAERGCWCSQFPPILPLTTESDCLCPRCLLPKIQQAIADYLLAHPAPEAIPSQYHTAELVEGVDYYREGGFWVFTEWYHRKRGHCCGNGCRHCGFKALK